MAPSVSFTIRRYVGAAVIVGLAVGLRLTLDPVLGDEFPFTMLYLGVLALISPALVLCLLYFQGFERPPHHSPSAGVEASLRTTLEFLSLGFGPAAKDLWSGRSSLAPGR